MTAFPGLFLLVQKFKRIYHLFFVFFVKITTNLHFKNIDDRLAAFKLPFKFLMMCLTLNYSSRPHEPRHLFEQAFSSKSFSKLPIFFFG
jgi:hypothetical protein